MENEKKTMFEMQTSGAEDGLSLKDLFAEAQTMQAYSIFYLLNEILRENSSCEGAELESNLCEWKIYHSCLRRDMFRPACYI